MSKRFKQSDLHLRHITLAAVMGLERVRLVGGARESRADTSRSGGGGETGADKRNRS